MNCAKLAGAGAAGGSSRVHAALLHWPSSAVQEPTWDSPTHTTAGNAAIPAVYMRL